MALTKEQFISLRNKGLSVSQIVKFEEQAKVKAEESKAIIQKAKEAEKFLAKPWYKQIFTKEFAEQTPKGVAQTFVGTPARVAVSLGEIPGTLASGKASGKQYNIPLVGKTESYQTEAAKRVAGGENPYKTIAMVGGKATLGVIETAGLAKGLIGDVNLSTGKTTKGLIPKTVDKASDIIKEQLKTTAQKNALKAVTLEPKELTPTQYGKFLEKNRVEPKTLLGQSKITPKEEIGWSKKWTDLLQGKDPIKNMNSVSGKITKIDESVGVYLKNQNLVYSKPKLKSFLSDAIESIGKDDVMIPNQKTLVNAKNSLVDTIINKSSDNLLEDLWRARKSFDRDITSKLNAFSGNPTLKKEIATTIRNATQDFISSQLPDSFYKLQMKNMTELIRIFEQISIKATKEKGLSSLNLFIKKNPAALKIIGTGALFGGGASLLK